MNHPSESELNKDQNNSDESPVYELIKLMSSVKLDTHEAKLNAISITDYNGDRIFL